MGCFEAFHENVFRAYFTDCKKIGHLEVLFEIVSRSGLNPELLEQALTKDRYNDRLKTADSEAKRLGIRSIPAFVFGNDEIILGALSPENFRNALEDIENGTYVKPLM